MKNEKVPNPSKKDLDRAMEGIKLESNRAEKLLTPEEAAALCDKIADFRFGQRIKRGNNWENLCEDFASLLDILPQNTFAVFQEEWIRARKFILFNDQARAFMAIRQKLDAKIYEILSSKEKSINL